MNTTQNSAAEPRQQQSTVTKAHLATKADPKWERRRKVIQALEDYKQRLDSRSDLRDRYEILCSRLYSGRSARITGMPTNHDQFAASDHLAELLDEKFELERLMAEAEGSDEIELALKYLDSQSRMFLIRFYLDDNPRKALSSLMNGLNYSSTQVYRIRNDALDKLYNILYAED